MAERAMTVATQDRAKTGAQFFSMQTLTRILTYIVLILGALVAVSPLIWMLSTSVMSLGEAQGVHFFPSEIHLENFSAAWAEAELGRFMFNSLRIALITLVGQLVVCVPAAYAFAKINFPGRDIIFGVLLSTIMIPAMVLIIPNFLTVTWLGRIGPIGWINNWPALTVPFMGNVFSIFLLRQFFAQVPDELFDAAQIDGAGHFRFLTRVVVPLARAPLMVVIVFSFMGSWNALAWPLLVTNTPEWRPITVGLLRFIDVAGQRLNLMMAGAVITIVPILILYFITQKQFTESIARSGLKG